MTIARNVLILVIAAELIAASLLIVRRLSRTDPPAVSLQRLDPLTASELEDLRDQARDGTGLDWRTLAEAYLGNGYYVAAEQCFRQVTESHPRDVQSRYGRGFCLERIGHTSQASQVLQQTAVVADPELARTCWYQVGRCYLREENAEGAEKAFRKIIDFPPAAYQVAKLLIRSDRSEEAVGLLDEHLKGSPRSLKLIQLRRHAAEALGNQEQARELADRELRAEYQLILEYNQNFISIFASRLGLSRLLSKAMQLRTEGTLQQRKRALDAALRIILPNNLWQYRSVLLAAAHVELGLGDIEASERLADLIEQNTQSGTDILDLRALIAESRGNHDAAYEFWSQAAELKPTSGFYQMLAESQADIDDAARRKYAALAAMYDGISAWRNDDMDAAMQLLAQARGVLTRNPTYHFYVGETNRVVGKIDDALAAYEACLQVNPDHGRCLERRQQLLESRAADSSELP